MTDDRLCPKCLAGRRRVRTSVPLPGGVWRRQYMDCPVCESRTTRLVRNAFIFERRKKITNVGNAPHNTHPESE